MRKRRGERRKGVRVAGWGYFCVAGGGRRGRRRRKEEKKKKKKRGSGRFVGERREREINQKGASSYLLLDIGFVSNSTSNCIQLRTH